MGVDKPQGIFDCQNASFPTGVQSDISIMISEGDSRRFVLPCITEQCGRIDYTLYHLDGVADTAENNGFVKHESARHQMPIFVKLGAEIPIHTAPVLCADKMNLTDVERMPVDENVQGINICLTT